MKKKILIITGVGIVILSFIMLICIIVFLYIDSGYGKCKFGESLRFEDKYYEQCVSFGTEVLPPLTEGKIVIRKEDWSGWTGDTEASSEEIEISKDGQEILLSGIGGDYTLTVVKVEGYTMELEVNGLGIQDETKESIDLNACGKQEFQLEFEEEIVLYTCTMDAGTEWQITFK